MNAPANIRLPAAIRLDQTDVEAAYRCAISIHCANCDEMEMAARCDIAALRDQAGAGLARASDSAAVLLMEVSRLASQAVYAPVSTARLILIRGALSLTMEAARAIERALRDGR